MKKKSIALGCRELVKLILEASCQYMLEDSCLTKRNYSWQDEQG